MKFLKSPWFRMILLLFLVAGLFYLPTREFLKVTGMVGIPAIFLAVFMHKQKKHSRQWQVAALCLVVLGGTYLYLMAHLPERIEVRRIIAAGGVLLQQGQYDRAIAEYSKLEKMGQTEKMQSKIEDVEKEKKAQRDLELAQQMVDKRDYDEARKLIEAIPRKTRAGGEAAKLLNSIPNGK